MCRCEIVQGTKCKAIVGRYCHLANVAQVALAAPVVKRRRRGQQKLLLAKACCESLKPPFKCKKKVKPPLKTRRRRYTGATRRRRYTCDAACEKRLKQTRRRRYTCDAACTKKLKKRQEINRKNNAKHEEKEAKRNVKCTGGSKTMQCAQAQAHATKL
jgi:hypothetical protein